MNSSRSPAAIFSDLDVSAIPSVESLDNPRQQALWVLWVGQERADIRLMTPGEISEILRDVYGISVPRQKVESILSKEKNKVVRRKANGRRAYQIMQAGIDEVAKASQAVMFVEPEKALSRIRDVQSLLGDLQGVLRVCDPYVDGRTLDFLAECEKATEIRLLTVNVNKPGPFRRDITAFLREHGNIIEVKVAPQNQLHDRYIIYDNRMLLFGTSLNGLGRKQSFVVDVGHDIRGTVMSYFDSQWQAASSV